LLIAEFLGVAPRSSIIIMPAWGKRRRGKQSSGRNTPNVATTDDTGVGEDDAITTDDNAKTDEAEDSKPEAAASPTTTTLLDTTDVCPVVPTTTAGDAVGDGTGGGGEEVEDVLENVDPNPLVLTSEKKRGIYECDYCHSDISQLPRIRCAVCPDFDLCLDCFATTDHTSAIARLKAAAMAHSEVNNNSSIGTSVLESSIMAPGVSSAAINHDNTHGYRVCDNTRYPILVSARNVIVSSVTTTTTTSVTRLVPVENSGKQEEEEETKDDPATNEAILEEDNDDKSTTDKDASNDTDDSKKEEEEQVEKTEDDHDKKDQKGDAMEEDVKKDDHDDSDEMEVDDGDEENAKSDTKEKDDEQEDEKGSDDTTPVDKPDHPDDTKTDAAEDASSSNPPQDPAVSATSARTAGAKSTPSTAVTTRAPEMMIISEDAKIMWTAEEDLRLLDAILTHGLGNWADISEAIGGNGSVGKTPKRCMERYFDDFLGRYGHILPPYTIVDEGDPNETNNNDEDGDEGTETDAPTTEEAAENATGRAPSKRRHAIMMRSPSNVSAASLGGAGRATRAKKFKVVPTESLPFYNAVWPEPYLPPIPGVSFGQEVARDLASKAELAFVKATTSVASKEEAEKIRQEWLATKMNQIGSPTVLPPRPDDTMCLPGADLAGFMPRRGDFDIEWENEAETSLADMEFSQGDPPQDKQLKLQVLEIYCQKLDEREKRKNFIMSRNLYDYRKSLQLEQEMPADERDLVRRMRLFERLHTPDEHKIFIEDILKAKRLRKEIAKLQMYRRIGIRSLAEAERYELDKTRREFHRLAQLQKDPEASSSKGGGGTGAISGLGTASGGTGRSSSASGSGSGGGLGMGGNGEGSSSNAGQSTESTGDSLWKKYRPSDRNTRRSINRTGSAASTEKPQQKAESGDNKEDILPTENKDETLTPKDEKEELTKSTETTSSDGKESQKEDGDKMDIDSSEPVKGDTEGDSKDSTLGAAETNTDKETSSNKDESAHHLDITRSKGYHLLSPKEVKLCVRVGLSPSQYLDIKSALIQESLQKGLLDKPGSNRRTVLKLDVERRGNVIDFMMRAGWISNKLANVARTVTPPPSE
jgi:Myb-like DNA-binding domain/Zinc finger, ZZ type